MLTTRVLSEADSGCATGCGPQGDESRRRRGGRRDMGQCGAHVPPPYGPVSRDRASTDDSVDLPAQLHQEKRSRERESRTGELFRRVRSRRRHHEGSRLRSVTADHSADNLWTLHFYLYSKQRLREPSASR